MLIRNATAILTGLAGDEARLPGPDIRVRDGLIVAIGGLVPEPHEPQLDATDCVIYPAWVNTHHHLFQSLLKGIPAGINASLTPWLSSVPYRYCGAFDEATFRIAVRIGLVELALSGCGTVADHSYLHSSRLDFDPAEVIFDEAYRLGLRMVLCRGGQTLPSPGGSLPGETLEQYLREVARLASLYHDPSPASWRRLVMAPTTSFFSMTPDELRACASEARRLGLRLHSHLSETVSYQDTAYGLHRTTPVRFCAEHDWMGSDVFFAHLVKLDQEEIQLLGSTRTGIAHCPQSNGRLGSGIAPVQALADAGAQISIGVDGAASNEAADMIMETHTAWLMQRAKAGESTVARYRDGLGESDAAATAVEQVVHWASAGGADVLGLGGTGRIASGYAADLAIYRLDDPRYFGLHDPAIGPVACGGTARLKALLVGGNRVVEEGAMPSMDTAELGRQARAAVDRLKALGLDRQ